MAKRMAKLLYIQASPRGGRSKSIRVAEAFLEAYRQAHGDNEVDSLNVFTADLPTFDGAVLDAKYAILHGQQATDEQRRAWRSVEQIIERFAAAGKYLFAVPMWNFGIPYRLKQYIDVLVQPGYTFSYDPQEGYHGLLTGRKAALVYARGGDYSPPELAHLDMQKPYLELILGFIGITDVRTIVVQPTLMGGPDVAGQRADEAVEQARELARQF